LELADATTGEKIVFDIFTALISIVSLCALLGAVAKITLHPSKVWDEEDWILEEIEEFSDYNEIRKENPHIWME
jgi:hypothetical protein